MLRQLPSQTDPNLLVGFETRDDAGVFLLSDGQALVQTIDFLTPIVDDPHAFGMIAATNALSDVYAMGGRPITAMNVACFDPDMAPPEVWSEIFRGMFEQCRAAGAAVVGGHSVKDQEPKFGLAVTGLVDPNRMFANSLGLPGETVWLSKPLGTGIVSTAIKNERASQEEADSAIASMTALNREACEAGQSAGVRCASDITGFGLAGHLFNIARASGIAIEINTDALPLLPGVMRMIDEELTTGGAAKNGAFLGEALIVGEGVDPRFLDAVLDPQTSGGLAMLCREPVEGAVPIGRALEGPARIVLV